MARRSFKFSKLRELHSAIGALIEESDSKMQAAQDEDDDSDSAGLDGPKDPHRRNRPAHDSAPPAGVPMHIGFPGFKYNK